MKSREIKLRKNCLKRLATVEVPRVPSRSLPTDSSTQGAHSFPSHSPDFARNFMTLPNDLRRSTSNPFPGPSGYAYFALFREREKKRLGTRDRQQTFPYGKKQQSQEKRQTNELVYLFSSLCRWDQSGIMAVYFIYILDNLLIWVFKRFGTCHGFIAAVLLF